MYDTDDGERTDSTRLPSAPTADASGYLATAPAVEKPGAWSDGTSFTSASSVPNSPVALSVHEPVLTPPMTGSDIAAHFESGTEPSAPSYVTSATSSAAAPVVSASAAKIFMLAMGMR